MVSRESKANILLAPIDEVLGNREDQDVGVKFLAWGMSPDRLYTGGSDGAVRVWNIRSVGKPLSRVLLDAPAPVVCGRFSPDLKKLVIGDASGRAFLLTVSEEDNSVGEFTSVEDEEGKKHIRRRPKPIIPHEDPAPPAVNGALRGIAPETAPELGNLYLQTGQLIRHKDPTIGVVQGPNYSQTGLYRAEFHDGEDPSMPLRAQFECKQQRNKKFGFRRHHRLLKPVKATTEATKGLHKRNVETDLDIKLLSEDVQRLLSEDEKAEIFLLETDCQFTYEDCD